MNGKANRLMTSLILGLGLILVLPVYLSGCTNSLGQVTVDDANDRDATKVGIHVTSTALLSTLEARGPIPGLGPCSTYAIYYGPLDAETLASLKAFDLVVLHPGFDITSAQVAELQAANVIVLGYVSIGEEPSGTPQVGDGLGPVYYDPVTSCAGAPNRHCGNKGVASYYLDEAITATRDAGHDSLPDVVSQWGGFYVDPASEIWSNTVRFCGTLYTECNFHGTDYVITTLGADGLFLDTVDTASPWYSYSYALGAMAKFIGPISSWYPHDKYIVLNRGIFFADPQYMADVVRPRINGIVFENYMTEWDWEKNEGRISPWFADNRDIWAPKLVTQAVMTDGYTLFALDYFTPTQQISITNQISETVQGLGWLDYIGNPTLNTVRWEVQAYCN
ncbi:MAG: hypothetical protein HYR94_03360 [Chloroflexi bacterium]|nr:hypothetical protein [Chloroflexota bacterium]